MACPQETGKGGTPVINANLWIGIFCGGLALLVFFMTRDLSRLGSVYVNFVLATMAILSVVMIARGLLQPGKIRFFETREERTNVTVGVVILVVYLILLPITGFLAASYLFYFCFNLYLADKRFSRRNVLQSAFLSILVVTAFYFVFHDFLEVPLPESMWAE
jgi:hypothetical protein